MICELVRTTAIDGVRLDGAWLSPAACEAAGASSEKGPLDAVVCLHGVASSFYGSNLFENLAPTFRSHGVGVLLANTRGHDTVHAASSLVGRRWMGAAFEQVDECRLDVAAWVEWLGRRGVARIGVVGHSLGAIKAVYSQATAPDPRVRAVIALSPPRLSYAAFRNGFDGAAFFEAMATARAHLEAGRGDALMQVKVPFPMLMSAAGYVEKYGPEERYNVLKFVDRLSVPSLFSYGGLELEQGGVAFAGMPEALRAARRGDQTLDVAVVPGADHNYARTHEPLAAEIKNWLTRFGAADNVAAVS